MSGACGGEEGKRKRASEQKRQERDKIGQVVISELVLRVVGLTILLKKDFSLFIS